MIIVTTSGISALNFTKKDKSQHDSQLKQFNAIKKSQPIKARVQMKETKVQLNR